MRLFIMASVAALLIYVFVPGADDWAHTWVRDLVNGWFSGSEVVVDRDGVDVEVGGALHVGGLR